MTRTKPRMFAALAGTMLLLPGCGSSDGSSDAAQPAATSPTTTSAPAPAPTAAPATTVTPTPTASTATAAQPTGRLIDYETTDEDGAMITVPADTGKLTGAPADFKTFIAGELSKKSSDDEGCTEPPQIYVSRLDTGGWARGGQFIPQCGGNATLWATTSGSWTKVWSGQSLVDCATLERFSFPVRVAGDSCLKGDDAVTYAG